MLKSLELWHLEIQGVQDKEGASDQQVLELQKIQDQQVLELQRIQYKLVLEVQGRSGKGWSWIF